MALDQTLIDNLAQVRRDLHDNADYLCDGTLTKAQDYVTALTRALHMLPQLASHGGSQAEEVRFDKQTMQRELAEAKKWLLAKKREEEGTGGFRYRQFHRAERRYA